MTFPGPTYKKGRNHQSQAPIPPYQETTSNNNNVQSFIVPVTGEQARGHVASAGAGNNVMRFFQNGSQQSGQQSGGSSADYQQHQRAPQPAQRQTSDRDGGRGRGGDQRPVQQPHATVTRDGRAGGNYNWQQHVRNDPRPAHGGGAASQGPHRREALKEGGQLHSGAKKDYDAIVRAFVDDNTLTELVFPSTLSPTERHHVHKLAMHFNLEHKSFGEGAERCLKISKKAKILCPSTALAPTPLLFNTSSNIKSQTRVKTVDMYQGAQFLHDDWLDENAASLKAALSEMHREMVRKIRAQMVHQRAPRAFRAVQPGLAAPPRPPADALSEKQRLEPFRRNLPTFLRRQEIVQAVRDNRVTIVSGDTGCGKTTQIPQLLLDAGLCSAARDQIICTQPRRISALSVAQRVAAERGQACGDEVGYIIRFENVTSVATKVVYCTNGILLRRLHSDPELSGVAVVVVDEVHERDADTDFSLLLLREILIKNPNRDLKVVVMSATIQIERLVDYFTTANRNKAPPLISIPGTLFRVDEYFLEDALEWLRLPASAAPAMQLQEQAETARAAVAGATAYDKIKTTALTEIDKELEAVVPYDVVVKLIEMYDKEQRNDKSGAILVFLPGWGPIDRVANMVRRTGGKFAVFMLHSSITAAEQSRVFYPPPRGFRKVVLATNVAETSITINDVTFVIDSGLSKGTAYDVAGNTSSLTCQLIAKANGIQRRGRAGRCRPGLCVHLLPRRAYQRLPDFLPPEILRTSLEEICLQIKAVKPDLKCVEVLSQALDAPSRDSIAHAVKFLGDLGALDPREQPTNLGRALATMPVHPTLGKMLLLAVCCGVLEPVAIIASCLSSKSPFVKPMPHQIDEMNAIRCELDQGNLSDHLMMLKVFQEWKQSGSQVDFAMRHMCDQSALRAIERTTTQLTRLVFHSGFLKRVAKEEETWYASRNASNTGLVRLVLLASLMPKLAVAERHRTRTKGDIFCWDNKPTQVHNSSILFKKKHSELLHREFLVYFDRMRIESQLQLFDVTTVSRTAALLCVKSVDVLPVAELSVTHVLEDAECKFGPFDGERDFPSATRVFQDLRGRNPQVSLDNTDEADGTEANGEAPPAASRISSDFLAMVMDGGIKCFLSKHDSATCIRMLRECMDFYFSLAMKHVDTTQFPSTLVKLMGQAIAFPVREDARPKSGNASHGNDGAASPTSGDPTELRTKRATWMSAKYSDDDADDKLLGGDDDGGEDDGMEVQITDDLSITEDFITDERRMHALYDAFGDLQILRRTVMESQRSTAKMEPEVSRDGPSSTVVVGPPVDVRAQHVDPTAPLADDSDEDDIVVFTETHS